jgi:hypothetical protein
MKQRNHIARVVTKIAPQVVQDARRRILEKEWKKEFYNEAYIPRCS